MALHEEFVVQGNWLFRWRSYLPFAFVVLVGIAYTQFDWPFESEFLHNIWEFVCLAISFFGLLVRMLTHGHTPARTSGRNTKRQVARELNTAGMYSVVRHPLYLGNYLIGLGIVLLLWVWWLPVIYTLAFWVYYERIMFAEEAFLQEKFGREFTDWSAVTPAFLPKLSLWRRPALGFSWRKVLGREYTGLIVVVLGHTGMEFFEHIVMYHRLGWKPFWIAFSISGTVVYLALREIKRKTTLLNVPGR
jgi:protein-S-isoprenylcysteine O-methyltransferase Ste14